MLLRRPRASCSDLKGASGSWSVHVPQGQMSWIVLNIVFAVIALTVTATPIVVGMRLQARETRQSEGADRERRALARRAGPISTVWADTYRRPQVSSAWSLRPPGLR